MKSPAVETQRGFFYASVKAHLGKFAPASTNGGVLSGTLRHMASVTFDTLKFAEKLIAAGVPEAQAKAEA